MFVISFKLSKVKALAALTLCAAIITIGGVYFVSKTAAVPTSADSSINFQVENDEQAAAFFSQFGYEINSQPSQIKEVIIPEEFDETYQNYNELQKQQGLDLERYKGARVKMRSYSIKNYPGHENDGTIYGNLLIYKGQVVGGDVSSVELDGFMHTFMRPESQSQ